MSGYEPSPEAINKARNLAVDRITAEVFEAFSAHGIKAILMKGPAHARWLYRPDHLRSYSDTDVLVSPSSVDEAERVLEGLGFELPPIYSEEDRPGFEHAWVRRTDGARVDLHWSLVGAGAEPLVWDVLSAATEELVVGGWTVQVFSESARALQVALHAAQHGSELGSAIDDLERALHLPLALWSEAWDLACRLDAGPSFVAGLRLEEAGRRIVAAIGAEDVEVPAEVAARASAAPAYELSLRWFLAQRGIRRKAGLITRNLFPPPGFMREWSPLARKGVMGLSLAYLWRPFRLLWEVGKALFGLVGRRRP